MEYSLSPFGFRLFVQMRPAVLIFLLPLFLYGQEPEYIPPGTVHIKGNVFMDATEVSNLAWTEFKALSPPNPLNPVPREATAEVVKNYRPGYFTNPAYRLFPVVGITQDQARIYCRWRSRVVNELLEEQYKNNILIKPYRVTYRLPSAQEWEEIARQTDSLAYMKPQPYFVEQYVKKRDINTLRRLLKDESLKLKEIKKAIEEHHAEDRIPVALVRRKFPWFSLLEEQLPRNVYYPVSSQAVEMGSLDAPLNLIGNVAELVQEAGVVKGGSWRHELAVSMPSKSIQIDPKKVYDWVGFRCICNVVSP